ncbi:MAG: hypothetical protein KDE14_00645, partial [Rhodobacteraceae bacterium]|nr:hypothetical protein [Paracoccaceae bacterium]
NVPPRSIQNCQPMWTHPLGLLWGSGRRSIRNIAAGPHIAFCGFRQLVDRINPLKIIIFSLFSQLMIYINAKFLVENNSQFHYMKGADSPNPNRVCDGDGHGGY